MKQFRNILVATDTRLNADPLVDEACDIAMHSDGKLKIVAVLKDSTWLARKTNSDLDHMRKLLLQEMKEKLDDIGSRCRAKGVSVTTKACVGNASVEITQEAIRGDHDLVMAVAKGQHSKRGGFFGQTAYRLLRKCPCAVWLFTLGSRPIFKHVLGCIDITGDSQGHRELNDEVLELSLTLGKYHSAHASLLYAWDLDDQAVLSARLDPEAVNEYVRDEHEHRRKKMEMFLSKHDAHPAAAHVHVIKGDTATVIADFARERKVDLIVMGTVARSGLSGFLLGNTAERILEHTRCSVLALKPKDFQSPLKIG